MINRFESRAHTNPFHGENYGQIDPSSRVRHSEFMPEVSGPPSVHSKSEITGHRGAHFLIALFTTLSAPTDEKLLHVGARVASDAPSPASRWRLWSRRIGLSPRFHRFNGQ